MCVHSLLSSLLIGVSFGSLVCKYSSYLCRLFHCLPLQMCYLRITVICPWLMTFVSLAHRYQSWPLSFGPWYYFTLSSLWCI
ncbi:hypothetical protein EDB85DRAFT_1927188 [Lactarius pseudohatsudake]|nr:hypothetical protein EDB85DRAFT_1927188 [Lactarius pseudohatsudake]